MTVSEIATARRGTAGTAPTRKSRAEWSESRISSTMASIGLAIISARYMHSKEARRGAPRVRGGQSADYFEADLFQRNVIAEVCTRATEGVGGCRDAGRRGINWDCPGGSGRYCGGVDQRHGSPTWRLILGPGRRMICHGAENVQAEPTEQPIITTVSAGRSRGRRRMIK